MKISGRDNVLENKIIVSTRATGKDAIAEGLQRSGANVISMPTIEIVNLIPQDIDSILSKINEFDYLVFTSRNAIKSLRSILVKKEIKISLISNIPLLVVGQGTAEEAENAGLKIEYISSKGNVSSLLEEIKDKVNLKNILLLQGELADNKLLLGLESFDAKVSRINLYNTTVPSRTKKKAMDIIVSGNYDLILFTSPSTFLNFLELAGSGIVSKEIKGAAIGKLTADSMRQKGVEPILTAGVSGADSFINEIENYFRQKK